MCCGSEWVGGKSVISSHPSGEWTAFEIPVILFSLAPVNPASFKSSLNSCDVTNFSHCAFFMGQHIPQVAQADGRWVFSIKSSSLNWLPTKTTLLFNSYLGGFLPYLSSEIPNLLAMGF